MTEAMYTSHEYLDKNPSLHVEHSAWKAGLILEMLSAHQIQPATVCEVGCGAGEILAHLSRALPAACCTGYDIAPDCVKLWEGRRGERLEFHCADLLALDRPPFDVALAIDVVEHIEDCFAFLRRLKEKGAYKMLHIPLEMNMLALLRERELPAVRGHVGHLHYFSKDTALALLKDCGYEVLDWRYTPASIRFAVVRKDRWLRWPRRALFAVQRDLAARWLGGYSLLVLAK